jgi:transcriptional regulator with XRE-family HTH domain
LKPHNFSHATLVSGFGEQLLMLRLERGLTLTELGEATELDVNTLRRIEIGLQVPRPLTLKKLADYFGMSVRELLSQDGVTTTTPAA